METVGLKVLIVDDRREDIVFLANNIFKPKVFEIITARDGKSGLRKALEEKPDLIMADLNVPRMRGLEIMADLHDRGSTIPFIIMTLHGSENTAVEAFRLGARDYLIKPLKIEDVEHALERALTEQPQATPAPNSDQTATIKALQNKIAELERVVHLQQKDLNVQQTSTATSKDMEQTLVQTRQELTHYTDECTRLKAQLEQQQQLADEAKNSTKALIQFVMAQQKELNRQKHDADKLIQQITDLSETMTKLSSRLNKQSDQFLMVTPNGEK